MAAVLDRMKAVLRGLARSSTPNIDYLGKYRAKLLVQHPSLKRVDVQPEDERLPKMSNIPLKVGVPGLDVTITAGHFVLVGWEGGRPDEPYATTWDAGTNGTIPVKLSFNGKLLELGGDGKIPLLPIDGAVTGQSMDPFTGLPHWMLGNASPVVLIKKVP